MASSLSESCNAAKQSYDTCFNHWFKSYLIVVAPPLTAPSDTESGKKELRNRQAAIKNKKEQYEKECGEFYRNYQGCLKKAIGAREGLAEMLETARREEPLDGWGGIKVATDDDLKGNP